MIRKQRIVINKAISSIRMRYFIPEWDDLVDPAFDFITDTHSESHNMDPAKNDAYMWDLFGVEKVPFDGVLVSIATIQQNKKKYRAILEQGIHKFFGLPKSFPIMADCGAFSYIDQPVPTYSTSDVLKIYSDLDFNYGVSVDHLVVTKYQNQAHERMRITYENGLEAYEKWKKKYRDDFQLIIAVQGLEVPDYIQMFDNFYKQGIRAFAFGGLVRSPTSYILDLINAIIVDIKKTKKTPEYIHFFGLARCRLFPKFKELEEIGIEVAFDSASYLRKAWLAAYNSQANYIAPNWNGYTAIRIPQKPKQREDSIIDKEYHQLENLCLSFLRDYDKGLIGSDKILESLTLFNEFSGEKDDLITYYKRTLEDRPWKTCDCSICKETGIDVVVFRGNNRNRRRGFHNTQMFYQMLKDETQWETCIKKENPGKKQTPPKKERRISIRPQNIKKVVSIHEEKNLDFLRLQKNVLLITGCTKSKLGCDESVIAPAKNMYQGTLFKKVREYAETMKFDYFIISAKYGVLHPDEPIEGYDLQLKTKFDIENIRPDVERKLKKWISPYDTIVVIAGVNYRKVLSNLTDKRFVFIKSAGIGDLISLVSKAIPEKNRNLNEF